MENLKKAQVWFSCPNAFNDPFDCRIRVDDDNLSEKDCQALYDWWRKNHPAVDFPRMLACADRAAISATFRKSCDTLFSDARHRYSDECGVCCFAEEFDNILMWSHYSDFHRGFCLGLRTSATLFAKARPITYSRDIPRFSPAPFFLDEDNSDIVNAMLWTKYETWIYEKEWRAVHKTGGTGYGYGADQLHFIYLGLEMPSDHKAQIRRIVNGHPVEIYEMTRHDSSFALVPRRL